MSIRDVRQGQYDAISCVRVCLFRSIVTMVVSVAVCEIFSAKEWCDLENRVRVRSRSLEMARFDRPCMTEIFIPHLYLAPLQGVTPSEFRKDV